LGAAAGAAIRSWEAGDGAPLAEENTLEKLKIMRVSVRAAPLSQTKAEGIFMVNGVLVVGL
jgi:hypothetical protein